MAPNGNGLSALTFMQGAFQPNGASKFGGMKWDANVVVPHTQVRTVSAQ